MRRGSNAFPVDGDERPAAGALTNGPSGLLSEPIGSLGAWFDDIAALILDATLLVDGEAHALEEIELYYHGPDHPDPFAHQHPLQKSSSRWYFHRAGESYRSGSFKGLDITFGPRRVFGGILVRSLRSAEGLLINGPSLCVDHMVRRSGMRDTASLDAALGERSVWDRGVLSLVPGAEATPAGPPLATARVGLTLKKMRDRDERPFFIMRRYRYLKDPALRKGALHTIIALYQEGSSIGEIAELTASSRRRVSGCLEAYREGFTCDFEGFDRCRRTTLSAVDLCRLHGIWQKTFGHLGAWPGPRAELWDAAPALVTSRRLS